MYVAYSKEKIQRGAFALLTKMLLRYSRNMFRVMVAKARIGVVPGGVPTQFLATTPDFLPSILKGAIEHIDANSNCEQLGDGKRCTSKTPWCGLQVACLLQKIKDLPHLVTGQVARLDDDTPTAVCLSVPVALLSVCSCC